MRKSFFLVLAALLTVPSIGLAAQVTGGQNIATSGNQTSSIARLSSNVQLYFAGDTAGYAIGTFHTNGSQGYGTAADTTSIYRTTDTTNVSDFTASDSSAFDGVTGWTQM